ncbi:MAG TPA: UDP-N-acetylmuramate--L-alanine ligase [Candidatus Binatia bacterium]|nr:UDP-N-acetylmuramate--L-alanine ligase [Candidatus Binatia bacterium]
MSKLQSPHHNEDRPLAGPLLREGMHVHLVGIGGSGMSAIAWLLLGLGYRVSGSDLQRSEFAAALEDAGATVYQGHDTENISGAELLVRSAAIPEGNVEVVAARDAGIPVLKRADLLGELMVGLTGIAIAGTHGKTTTTSLIAHILLETGRDPSVVVGGMLPQIERNGRAGESEYFVIEADEYDHMFLGLLPKIAVVTNVEHDHPDLFATADVYLSAFEEFIERLPRNGTLVCCSDDGGVRQLLQGIVSDELHVVTYGIDEIGRDADYRAVDVRPNQLGGSDFVVLRHGETLGVARQRLPGAHNVRNALAAIAVCDELGVAFSAILPALMSFGGVDRRFQLVGQLEDVTVIDDYAHHPTEIRATLAAARQRYPGRRLWAIWQPHTYSRTRLLMREFGQAFGDADRVIVLDVYRSRETDTLGVDAGQVVSAMDHANARHIGDRRDAAQYVLDRVRPGDVVLTLGAGDGYEIGSWVIEGLRQRVQGNPQEGSDGTGR